MPAVPGSGFVVVEPELVFGCLEAILDRPAMALDAGLVLAPLTERCVCCGLERIRALSQKETPGNLRMPRVRGEFVGETDVIPPKGSNS
jgi:hypothetical protein